MNFKKFRRDPTQEQWDAAVAEVKRYRDLDRKPFRQKLARLARELEKLGHAAHRDGDRLENLSMFSDEKFKDVNSSAYTRSRIEAQFKRWYKDQLHFIQPQLDRLMEVGKSGRPNLIYSHKNLRRQAATLLDAAEYIDYELKAHAQGVKEIRERSPSGKSGKGRPPSTARRAIVLLLIKWNFTPTTLSDRLRKSGIAVEPENLKVASWLASR